MDLDLNSTFDQNSSAPDYGFDMDQNIVEQMIEQLAPIVQ
jgi:hypothetical protein